MTDDIRNAELFNPSFVVRLHTVSSRSSGAFDQHLQDYGSQSAEYLPANVLSRHPSDVTDQRPHHNRTHSKQPLLAPASIEHDDDTVHSVETQKEKHLDWQRIKLIVAHHWQTVKQNFKQIRKWWQYRKIVNRAHFLGASFMLLFNIVFFVTAEWHFQPAPGQQYLRVLTSGSCKKISHLNGLFHAIINVVSTLLLWSSNYTIQVLMAPNREEVDALHQRGLYFDIGVSSLRNFWRIPAYRRLLIVLIALPSTALHLFYNGAVLVSKPTTSYAAALVTHDFLVNPRPWDTQRDTFQLNYLQANAHNYNRIEKPECLERYLDMFSAGKDVIVVTYAHNNSKTYNDNTSLLYDFNVPGGSDPSEAPTWMCATYRALMLGNQIGGFCTITDMRPYEQSWEVGESDSDGQFVVQWSEKVDYCLSDGVQDFSNMCGLYSSSQIIIAVCCLNGMFVLVTAIALFDDTWDRNGALLLLGDAQQSFLERPDQTTANSCLLTKSEIDEQLIKEAKWDPPSEKIRTWHQKTLYWYQALGWGERVLLVSLALTQLVGASYWLFTASRALYIIGQSTSPSALLQYGLGNQFSFNTVSGIGGRTTAHTFWMTIIIANLPQLAVSISVQVLRVQIGKIFVADEWQTFACHYLPEKQKLFKHLWRKTGAGMSRIGAYLQNTTRPSNARASTQIIVPEDRELEEVHNISADVQSQWRKGRGLRVSYPRSELQHTALFLTIPMLHALTISSISIALHYFLSQGVFATQTTNFHSNGLNYPENDSTYIAFSPLGAILTLLTIVIALSIFIWNAIQKYPGGERTMPLVSTCSLAISAACHADPEELKEKLWLKPLRWGVITDRHGIEHCCFTSRPDVELPMEGRAYSRPWPSGDHARDQQTSSDEMGSAEQVPLLDALATV